MGVDLESATPTAPMQPGAATHPTPHPTPRTRRPSSAPAALGRPALPRPPAMDTRIPRTAGCDQCADRSPFPGMKARIHRTASPAERG